MAMMVTPRDAAHVAGTNIDAIYKRIRAGGLQPHAIGGAKKKRWLISVDDLRMCLGAEWHRRGCEERVADVRARAIDTR